jgi:cytoskeletal protein RodZ
MEKENSRPNARVKVKLQTLSKSVSKMFKQGEIVWVNLGISFSWWPGEFQEVAIEKGKKTSDLDLDINVYENPFKNVTSNSGDTVLDTDGGLQTREKSKEEVNDSKDKNEPFKVSELNRIALSSKDRFDLVIFALVYISLELLQPKVSVIPIKVKLAY